jgi:cellulose biosynthesis protein BcsQ
MHAVAVYSPKGGVGKTTLAVNLAWCSAALSARRTLLWDLDAQGAATFLLGSEQAAAGEARAVLTRDAEAQRSIRPTGIDRLDLLPADASLRGLDGLFAGLGKKRRLQRLLESLAGRYDRIVLDCPPGLTETTGQVIRGASAMVVPVVPSPLSRRALDEIARHLEQAGRGRPAMLPVFAMADRRRTAHLAALAEHPDWPVIPMASVVEQIAIRRRPLGAFAPAHLAARAVAGVWTAIERRLTAA